MKPTQEQVIAWAREAGIDWLIWQEVQGDLKLLDDEILRFATIAYEAGRKDENEAAAKVCEDIDAEYEGEDVLATWCVAAIRARREQ